jgi:hypothetical protein
MKIPDYGSVPLDMGDVRVSGTQSLDDDDGVVYVDLWVPVLPHPTDPTGHARLTLAQASCLGRVLADFAAANSLREQPGGAAG